MHGFFDKIKAGLKKTRDALSNTLGSVFSGFSEIDDDFYDELEESLILADLGVDTAVKATDLLRKRIREQHLKTTEEAKTALKEILVDMLNVGDTALNLSTKPSVILVIGVNGVGKTTTIGKIATQLVKQGNAQDYEAARKALSQGGPHKKGKRSKAYSGKRPGKAKAMPATYKIKDGDTLWDIARTYGTSVSAIQAANGGSIKNLKPGKTIRMPKR